MTNVLSSFMPVHNRTAEQTEEVPAKRARTPFDSQNQQAEGPNSRGDCHGH